MMKTPEQTGAQGTLVNENAPPDPSDTHKTGTGSPDAPGGATAPTENVQDMTHGQEGYPGYRPAGEDALPGAPPPEAGDTDPGSTASADATGQDGNLNDPGKKTGLPWK